MEQAERLTRRRARIATVMGILFVVTQAGSLGADPPLNRPQTVQLAAWTVWAAVLLFLLVAGGGLLRGPKVRALMNDESTTRHRALALQFGFWAAIATSFAVYLLDFYEPISARQAVRLVITAAVAVALVRFGTLERRSLGRG